MALPQMLSATSLAECKSHRRVTLLSPVAVTPNGGHTAAVMLSVPPLALTAKGRPRCWQSRRTSATPLSAVAATPTAHHAAVSRAVLQTVTRDAPSRVVIRDAVSRAVGGGGESNMLLKAEDPRAQEPGPRFLDVLPPPPPLLTSARGGLRAGPRGAAAKANGARGRTGGGKNTKRKTRKDR